MARGNVTRGNVTPWHVATRHVATSHVATSQLTASCKDARDIYNGLHIMQRHNPASVHTLRPCSLPSIMQRSGQSCNTLRPCSLPSVMQRSGQSCSGAFKKRRRAPKARVRARMTCSLPSIMQLAVNYAACVLAACCQLCSGAVNLATERLNK